MPFGETLSGGACGADLHSAVFHLHCASELWILLSRILQCACCEWVMCLNQHFCGVQMLLFSGASERGGSLGKSVQVKVIQ